MAEQRSHDAPARDEAVWVCATPGGTRRQLRDAADAEGVPCRFLDDASALSSDLDEASPAALLVEHAPPRIYAQDVSEAWRDAPKLRSARGETPLVVIAQPEAARLLAGLGATEILEAPLGEAFLRARLRGWSAHRPVRWQRAPTPEDEAARLDALAGLRLLDSPPEERFDRITRIACAALDVPIALVSLVDRDRQWFKSCQGLDVSETARDVAFCAHAVAARSELLVPDASQDDRFADNPLVAGPPGIRFYAGTPLIVDDGGCLGTLCVIDLRPRHFGKAELELLRDLRDLVMREIALGPESSTD